MTKKISYLALLVCLVLLAACAPETYIDRPAVFGTIVTQEGYTLPADALIQVQLQDTSLQDNPAAVMGEMIFTADGQQPPIPFEVPYNEHEIDPSHTYEIRVRITGPDGALLFTNTSAYPVLTNGAPHFDVEVLVEKVN